MMVLMGALVFSGALALAMAVIWTSIAPQWQRIVRLAGGHVERPFQPLGELARAEQRIAIRRWAASSAVVPLQQSLVA